MFSYSHYVGKYYGATNEIERMDAIHHINLYLGKADGSLAVETDRRQPTVSKLDQEAPIQSAIQSRTMRETSLHKKTDGRRQSIDTQIKALKAEMDQENRRIRHLLMSGKNDAAINRMRWQIQRHDRLQELVAKYQEAMAIVHAAKHVAAQPSKIKLEVKRRAYKRWSDK